MKIVSYYGQMTTLRAPTDRSSRSKAGYSLVEALIVAIVVGVISALFISRVGDASSDLAVRAAADQFRTANNAARTIALRSNRTAFLRVDASGDRFWVQVDTSLRGRGVFDTIGNVSLLGDSDIDLSSTAAVLCFDARGIPTSAGVCDDQQAARLVFTRGADADTAFRTAAGVVVR